MADALEDVRNERKRQDVKWGQQDHADVDPVLTNRPGGCTSERMAEEYSIPTARRAQTLCDMRFKRGDRAWADILIEEVAEAVEAATIAPDGLRDELVQVAAVAVAWVEAIDRRNG